MRFFNHTHDLLELGDGVDPLERAHEQQARHVTARVALTVGGRDEALLDVVVDHRAGQRLLVGQAHEGELVGHEGDDLVEVELDARQFRDAVDAHGGHVRGERARLGLRLVRGDLARSLCVLLGLLGAHRASSSGSGLVFFPKT